MWRMVYRTKLSYFYSPMRYICIFPNFILKRTGFLYKTTVIYLEPKDILPLIFNDYLSYHQYLLSARLSVTLQIQPHT